MENIIHGCVAEMLQHLGNINNLYLENFSTQAKWYVLESLRNSTIILNQVDLTLSDLGDFS